jgi:Reverse transcriptase (RNA-dependent DNA polymerase)
MEFDCMKFVGIDKSSTNTRANHSHFDTVMVDTRKSNSTDKASPVVNDITIRIISTLIVMAGWWAGVVDVKGAFLTADFEPHHKMYVTVAKGFEKYYPGNVVLLLKRTLYGTCQAAIQFWKKSCAVMAIIGVQRSKADVCLFFQWTSMGMLVCLSWVDDILIAGSKESVLRVKANLRQHFTLDEQGQLFEYVGCKNERDKKARWMKLTQPVRILFL